MELLDYMIPQGKLSPLRAAIYIAMTDTMEEEKELIQGFVGGAFMEPQVPVDRHSDFAPLADDAHLQTTVLADGGIQAGTQHRLLDGVGQARWFAVLFFVWEK